MAPLPSATEGVVDLSAYKGGLPLVPLHGEWRHVRGALVPTGESLADAPLATLPSAWADDPSQEEEAFGLGTYSLTVHLPDTGGRFAVRTGRTYAASTVFVDGERVASSGRVGTDAATSRASLRTRIIELPPDRSTVELRVWVSNHAAHAGGLRRTWTLGPSEAVHLDTARDQLKVTVIAAFLAAVGSGAFVLWLVERRRTDQLWFAALTLVAATRAGVGEDAHLVALLLPELGWPDQLRIEYASVFMVPALGIALIARMFPRQNPARITAAIMVAATVTAVVSVSLAPWVLGRMVPVVMAFLAVSVAVCAGMLVRAFRAGEPQAGLLLFTVGVVGVTSGHDVLAALHLIQSDIEVAPWGFITLVTVQAYVLARTYAASMRTVERLSLDITSAHNDLLQTHEAVVRFVPYEFLSLLGHRSITDVQRGDHVAMDVDVMFCDIRSYTSLVEGLGPSEAFALINEWLSAIEPHVHSGGGFVKEYLGDCVVALFPGGSDATLAACVQMHRSLRAFSDRQTIVPGREISAGMGLHAGPLVMGTIGGDTRLDTGAVGDVVNTAARVEGLTRRFGTDLIITETIVDRLVRPEAVQLRELDAVVVKGRSQPVRVFEVLDALPDATRDRRLATRDDYAAGLAALRAGENTLARDHFERCRHVAPDDLAAQVMVERCMEAAG